MIQISPEELVAVSGGSAKAVEDFGTLLNLFFEYMVYAGDVFENAAGETAILALINHEWRVRCSSQYLFCRQKYGDNLLQLFYRILMPALDELAEKCHMNVNTIGMGYAASYVLLGILQIQECPELRGIYAKLNERLDTAMERNMSDLGG